MGVLLQESMYPPVCASETCTYVCLKLFIVVDLHVTPLITIGTQMYDQVDACNCPREVLIARSNLSGSLWSSAAPYGTISFAVQGNSSFLVRISVGTQQCFGIYGVLYGSVLDITPPVNSESGIMKRINVVPSTCITPTCPYLCGDSVSAKTLGSRIFIQSTNPPSLCHCQYAYAVLNGINNASDVVASATGVFSSALAFNASASRAGIFHMSYVDPSGIACYASYGVAVGRVLGLGPAGMH